MKFRIITHFGQNNAHTAFSRVALLLVGLPPALVPAVRAQSASSSCKGGCIHDFAN
ncbi:MAG TPA: hypothetical protein V6C52_10240 [Coleofasciculaceae cyanobacterium]|jgi:hypothetical protein